MSLTLYYAPGACSFVPHVLLQASGAAFEPTLLKLHKGEQREAAYLAINPRGQVPVLVDSGTVITQIAAICLHLDALFPGAHFLPTSPIARAKALETLAWMNNTVHPTFTHYFMPNKFTDQPEAQAVLKTYAAVQYRSLMDELQQLVQLAQQNGQAWLSGANLGPLDAYALTLLRWGTMAGINPVDLPVLWSHVQKVAEHAAVKAVMERERLVLNLFKG
ncbi:MAG: glutathione S-transferase family protein [Betaproteobacteria bacterium]|jgi:glutathione S-transferase|nr:glutathione S-transferase family protein [Betaproteobacteria bacterium]